MVQSLAEEANAKLQSHLPGVLQIAADALSAQAKRVLEELLSKLANLEFVKEEPKPAPETPAAT